MFSCLFGFEDFISVCITVVLFRLITPVFGLDLVGLYGDCFFVDFLCCYADFKLMFLVYYYFECWLMLLFEV